MHRLVALAASLLSTLVLLPAASAQEGHPRDLDTLAVADYLEFEQVSDARISPDGSQIVYTRRWVDAQTDRWSSSLWILDLDGGVDGAGREGEVEGARHRLLIEGSNARWSPSGDRILFLAPDEHDKPQIFVRWMDGSGAVSQVTRVHVSPSSPTWSPDGRRIAFVAIVPESSEWALDMPAPPEGAEWTEPPRILDRLHYRQDRVGFTDPGFSHLFVVPASSGTARQLTHGKWNVGAQFDGLFFGAGLSWMPDGKTLVFDGLRGDDVDSPFERADLFAVDVESAEVRKLTTEPGYWTDPAVSPDGRHIAYAGYPRADKTYQMPRLRLMASDGSDARIVSESFDRSPASLLWTADGDGLLFSAQDEGYVHVFHASLDGEVRRLTEGPRVVELDSLDRSGRTGAGLSSAFHEPGDVVSLSFDQVLGDQVLGDKAGTVTPRRLTAVNDDLLAGKTLGEQEEIFFEASDGQRAHGWIVKPPDFDPEAKYPLLMEIHGGPFAMYEGKFDFRYQAFASLGFVVLYTNPRGSTGYGDEFTQAIDHAYPSVDHLDLMAGVDAALATGFVDEKRLYVGGCSGGGVLSSWAIGQTGRFAAAAVRCPVVNWLSMAGTTDIPNFTYAFFRKPFWEDPSDWLHHSPIMHVGKVTTPTLVMTGEEDLRTPMAQSEEYYAALKMRGVPAKLLRFAGEYHGTGSRPSNYMRTILYMADWYGRWTLDGPVETSEDGGTDGSDR